MEGAPDPFPALREDPTPTTKPKVQVQRSIDTNSETAFPSLAPSPSTAPTRPTWGASAGGPRIAPAVPSAALVTDRITLNASDIAFGSAGAGAGGAYGRDNKPVTSLGDALRQLTLRHPKVKCEASSNAKTRQTTFFFKAESAKELERARRTLLATISPWVSGRFGNFERELSKLRLIGICLL